MVCDKSKAWSQHSWFAKGSRAWKLQFKEDSKEYDNLAFSSHQTAVIDLSPDEDTIWKGVINSKRRNMIRKALKSGVKIRLCGPEGFELYYPLMTDMHDKANLETKPVSYYENVLHKGALPVC